MRRTLFFAKSLRLEKEKSVLWRRFFGWLAAISWHIFLKRIILSGIFYAIWWRLRKISQVQYEYKKSRCLWFEILFLPFKIMFDNSDALRFGYILPMVFMVFLFSGDYFSRLFIFFFKIFLFFDTFFVFLDFFFFKGIK